MLEGRRRHRPSGRRVNPLDTVLGVNDDRDPCRLQQPALQRRHCAPCERGQMANLGTLRVVDVCLAQPGRLCDGRRPAGARPHRLADGHRPRRRNRHHLFREQHDGRRRAEGGGAVPGIRPRKLWRVRSKYPGTAAGGRRRGVVRDQHLPCLGGGHDPHPEDLAGHRSPSPNPPSSDCLPSGGSASWCCGWRN